MIWNYLSLSRRLQKDIWDRIPSALESSSLGAKADEGWVLRPFLKRWNDNFKPQRHQDTKFFRSFLVPSCLCGRINLFLKWCETRWSLLLYEGDLPSGSMVIDVKSRFVIVYLGINVRGKRMFSLSTASDSRLLWRIMLAREISSQAGFRIVVVIRSKRDERVPRYIL